MSARGQEFAPHLVRLAPGADLRHSAETCPLLIQERTAGYEDGEPVITKAYPNSFVGTDLQAQLDAAGVNDLVLAGFMTHMCINSTARGAFSLGFRPTVVASATATRDLPAPDSSVVPASQLQAASLATLADLFAVVAPRQSDIRG